MTEHPDATEFIGGVLLALGIILPHSLLAKYITATIGSAVYEWILDTNPMFKGQDFFYRQVALTGVFLLAVVVKAIFAL